MREKSVDTKRLVPVVSLVIDAIGLCRAFGMSAGAALCQSAT